MEFFKDTNYDFLGKKVPFIGASVLLLIAGFVSLAMKGGPKYGIDFNGGTSTSVVFQTKPSEDVIRKALSAKVAGEVTVQPLVDSNAVLIGTELRSEKELIQSRETVFSTLANTFGNLGGKSDFSNIGSDTLVEKLEIPFQQASIAIATDQLRDLAKAMLAHRDKVRGGLIPNFDDLKAVPGVTQPMVDVMKKEMAIAPYHINSFDQVGPKIGRELRMQALYATLFALGGMLIYIALRFEWIYGVAAVAAVFHDTLITIGLFSIVDKEITLTVVAALLTLVGYSMNDTIVVFDRIRENMHTARKDGFAALINASINQTLSRTVMASGLTFLTVVALWLFGGPVLNGFSFALVMGILVGTYSSIFVASPILIWGQQMADSRRKQAAAVAPTAAKNKERAKVIK